LKKGGTQKLFLFFINVFSNTLQGTGNISYYFNILKS